MRFTDEPVRVRVPATSANLGPCFDCAGLALARYDEIEARVVDTGLAVRISGVGADYLYRDGRHLVVRAARAAFRELGGEPSGLQISCTNAIPHSRGLGSSAAAIVGGIVAARLLAGCSPADATGEGALALACRLEGHPDNVAACLLGGVTFAWSDAAGTQVLRLDPHPALEAVVAVPRGRLATAAARGLLPASVPHADAAANSARAALLGPALASRPDLLLAATQDALHQAYRRAAMPATLELLSSLRAAGHAAVVSGAGPSVLVLGTGDALPDAGALVTAMDPDWTVLRLPIDRGGTTIQSASAVRAESQEC